MRKLIFGLAMVSFMAVNGFSSTSEQQTTVTYSVECCKICKKGKACGDSCISKDYQCHKPKGCACNG